MKLDRLLAITMALLNQKRVSATALAERFEVSLRTIYRDMDTINQAGIPIVSFAGADGGYEIMPGYRLDKQYLSLDDFASICSALRGVQSATDDQDIAALLDRIGALVPERTPSADTYSLNLHLTSSQGEKEKIRTLHTAIRESRIIAFDYVDVNVNETSRSIEPMGIYLKGYAWYIYGYCLLREDLRTFRLSRMINLDVLMKTFVRRNITLKDLETRRMHDEQLPTTTVVLCFKAKAKTRVRDEFEADQIEVNEEGALLVTAPYYSMEHAVHHILSYGADVKVLEPAALVDDVRRQIAEMANLYL